MGLDARIEQRPKHWHDWLDVGSDLGLSQLSTGLLLSLSLAEWPTTTARLAWTSAMKSWWMIFDDPSRRDVREYIDLAYAHL